MVQNAHLDHAVLTSTHLASSSWGVTDSSFGRVGGWFPERERAAGREWEVRKAAENWHGRFGW